MASRIHNSGRSKTSSGHTEGSTLTAAFYHIKPARMHSQQDSETRCTATLGSRACLSLGWSDQRHALRDTPQNGCRDCRWKVLFGRQTQRSWCISFRHIDLQRYHYIGMTARGRQDLLISAGCPLWAIVLPQAFPPCTALSTKKS